MALTPYDIWACQQVWKWEHPQHSFFHNLVEGAGQLAEDVGEHLVEEAGAGAVAALL